jgi:hypothetical protein
VSFVIIGRNDGYMGDYLYRLGTSVSFAAQSAEAAGLLDRFEVVIVDWASQRPLSGDLPLVPAARRITRFVYVPEDVARARFDSDRFHPTCAVNVGVRRARGEFIFFTDSDCLWTEAAMAALGRLLRGETTLPAPVDDAFCYVRRYQIPWATAQRKPHLQEWRRLAGLLVAGVAPENPAATCLGGFSGGQLMHRDLWYEARGYDESLNRSWGWSDNDLVLRVTQRHTWVDVSGYGFFGLHMEHWPHEADRAARDQATVNPMVIRNVVATNGDTWGLGDVDLPEAASTCANEPVHGLGCAVPLTGQTADGAWRPGPDAAAFVRRIRAAAGPDAPQAQLEAVAQIALADRPRAICWFGAIVPSVLQTIVAAVPGAEMFFINPRMPGNSAHAPFTPADFAGNMQAWRFHGWSRIVQGNPATALDRVTRSHPGFGPVELAWIDPAVPDAALCDLGRRLAPGGVVLAPPSRRPAPMLERLRRTIPGAEVHALRGTGLLAATRPIGQMTSQMMTTPRTDPAPAGDGARSLRAVFDMLLHDKALQPVDPDTLPWDRPIFVIRSAHMGRMDHFFQQVAARSSRPDLHVLSHARDEDSLRTLAPFPFTFHAWPTPGPYRLENLPAPLLERLQAQRFARLFFLQNSAGDRLEEVERLLMAIQPGSPVCLLSSGAFAQAADARQRQLAEAAFLRLIEWYQFRLDPAGASLASTEETTGETVEIR